MPSKRVFEISNIVPVLPDIWVVQGRAYVEISAGDSVSVEVDDMPDVELLLRFKVVAASTYGYLLQGLSESLTGSLTLVAQGPIGEVQTHTKRIHEAKFLISYQS